MINNMLNSNRSHYVAGNLQETKCKV